jgi:manganese/iron transport system permease protein
MDAATGAAIVLVQAAVFVLAFLFAPKHGLLAAWRRGRVEPPATETAHSEGIP